MFQLTPILLNLNTERQYARHGAVAPTPFTAHTPDRYRALYMKSQIHSRLNQPPN